MAQTLRRSVPQSAPGFHRGLFACIGQLASADQRGGVAGIIFARHEEAPKPLGQVLIEALLGGF